MTKTIFNGIAAVFAGFFAIVLLSLIADYGLLKLGLLATGISLTAKLSLSIGKEFLIGILGAWLTVWLGKKHHFVHALALAAVMTAVVLIPVSAKWQQNPQWFSLVMLALPTLYALAGALVYRQTKG